MEPMRADNLDKVAKEKGLVVRVTAPLSPGRTQRSGGGPGFCGKGVRAGTPDDPFAGPIVRTP